MTCPLCTQRWLALGVREGDPHTCKSCGHQFVVRTVAASDRAGGPHELSFRAATQ